MIEAELFECLNRSEGEIAIYIENFKNLVIIGCLVTNKVPLVSFYRQKWRSIADFTRQGKGFVLEYIQVPNDKEDMDSFPIKLQEKAESYGKMVDKWMENKRANKEK